MRLNLVRVVTVGTLRVPTRSYSMCTIHHHIARPTSVINILDMEYLRITEMLTHIF